MLTARPISPQSYQLIHVFADEAGRYSRGRRESSSFPALTGSVISPRDQDTLLYATSISSSDVSTTDNDNRGDSLNYSEYI